LCSLTSDHILQLNSAARRSRFRRPCGLVKTLLGRKIMKCKVILATMALLIGGLIYACCRSECLVMFTWFDQLGIGDVIRLLRASSKGVFSGFPEWFRMSLPNALWLFSGLVLLDSIWPQRFILDKWFWLAVFWFSAVGSEFAQGMGVLPGTFDPHDIFFMFTATGFAALFMVHPRDNEKRVKPCSTSAS
jgi:hypothetical protein